MQALDKKLLRDFKRLWLQALAIAAVLACGVAILITSFGMHHALQETKDAYYQRNQFADVFAHVRRAPMTVLEDIARISGVQNVEARITGFAVLDLPNRTAISVGKLISRPEDGAAVLNRPVLVSGRWPEQVGEVVVNTPFAEANEFRLGDTFRANIDGVMRPLTITGTALSPEYIFTIGPGSLMPDNARFGILWMSHSEMAAAYDMIGAFNDLTLKLTRDAREADVLSQVDSILGIYGGVGAYGRDIQMSNAFIDAEIAQLRSMALILPPIFFAIAGFLVSMVIGRIIALERAEIGLLKAFGYSDLEICLHYLMLAALIAGAAIGLGWGFGTWLSQALAREYAAYFNFPFLILKVAPWVYAVSALAALLATTLGAARSALAAARLSPAVAMQPPSPARFKRSLVDILVTRLHWSQPTIMIMRSIARWPVRSALSVLGLAFAVASVVSSVFFNDALDEIMDMAFFQSNRQDLMLLLNQDLPETAIEDALDLPGVLQAEGMLALPVTLRSGPYSKRVSLEARGAAPDLARVMTARGEPVRAEGPGILLSERLAEQLRVRPGDPVLVEFKTGARDTHQFTLSGTVTQHFGLGAYVSEAELARRLQQMPQISAINVTVDPKYHDPVMEQLKELPTLNGVASLDESRVSFQETIRKNVTVMNTIYVTVAVLITIGVTYNGARIQLSERARELASLRILGFTKGEVSYILVGETLVLALAAQPIGWLIGAWIAKAMTDGFTSDLYSIPLVLKAASFSTASLIVLGAALASVMIVRRRLDRLDLVSVMKTRE